ncbi:Ankyrin repeat-containing domain [Phytophthora cactorum]|nr:Ankyrin repeat-containing domain [Phytophthora cactorum]
MPELQLAPGERIAVRYEDPPLFEATKYDNTGMVTLLLSRGASLKDRNLVGHTLLHATAEYNAQHDEVEQQGNTALHYAVDYGRINLAAAACCRGRCEYYKYPNGDTSPPGNITKMLLLNGKAGPNKKDYNGTTPLHDAIVLDEASFAEEESQAGYTVIEEQPERIHVALVQLLLSQGADVNVKNDTSGYSPLHQALYDGYERTAAKSKFGVTPLHVAAAFAFDASASLWKELLAHDQYTTSTRTMTANPAGADFRTGGSGGAREAGRRLPARVSDTTGLAHPRPSQQQALTTAGQPASAPATRMGSETVVASVTPVIASTVNGSLETTGIDPVSAVERHDKSEDADSTEVRGKSSVAAPAALVPLDIPIVNENVEAAETATTNNNKRAHEEGVEDTALQESHPRKRAAIGNDESTVPSSGQTTDETVGDSSDDVEMKEATDEEQVLRNGTIHASEEDRRTHEDFCNKLEETQQVDVYDVGSKDWLAAKIVGLNDEGYTVHYMGWNSKCDEKIDKVAAIASSPIHESHQGVGKASSQDRQAES